MSLIVMFYNGKCIKAVYEFDEKRAMSLFERNAYQVLSFLASAERKNEMRWVVSTEMYATGEFKYALRLHIEGIKMPAFCYCVESYVGYFEESIRDEGEVVFIRSNRGGDSLLWDGNFFGSHNWLPDEEGVKYLKEYDVKK